jgi:hypothetical protein
MRGAATNGPRRDARHGHPHRDRPPRGTDIGIELGKLMYWNKCHAGSPHSIIANRSRLKVHTLLVASFFVGGVIGALGFKYAGFASTIPLALPLIAMSLAPSLQS